MREWLYEAGIGEARAALIEDGAIVAARIEADDEGIRAGTVAEARLARIVIPGRRAIVTLDTGEDALIEPVPEAVPVEPVRPVGSPATRPLSPTCTLPCPCPRLSPANPTAHSPQPHTPPPPPPLDN